MAYASKYYDPAKAHEYYLKRRELKGKNSRSSTAGLNEQGKIAAKEVKEAIKAEKKAYMDELKNKFNEKIKQLREAMKGRSKGTKEKYKQMIAELREKYKATKDAAKEAFNEKYLKELDAIKNDSGMKKGKSSGKKKGKSKK